MKEQRIVFLDLDQVLFDYRTFRNKGKITTYYGCIEESVLLLKNTLEETDAKIVFITSWDKEKILRSLNGGELSILKDHVYKNPYVRGVYRRGDRTEGILRWFIDNFGECEKTGFKDPIAPIVMATGQSVRFAIVDDSTGLYMRWWAGSRLVPVINHRFGNYENQLLRALLTGKDIEDAVQEMKRRADILNRQCRGMYTREADEYSFRQ